jgi:AraC family transcriptional activator of pobA
LNETFKIFHLDADSAKKSAAAPNDPHHHDFEELIVGIEGQLEHFIDFKTEVFDAPFVSFVTKGKLHRVKPLEKDGKLSFWVIRFKSEFIADITFSLYAYYHDNANTVLKADNCFLRLSVICEMMDGEMKRESPDYAVIRNLLITLLTMIESERRHLRPESLVVGNQNTTFKNFLNILEENFRRPEGVEYYAEQLFMSSRNLNIITKNILHQSVSEIIETRKLIEAKNLLVSTDKTVAEIGFELGYNEKSYFTSVFRRRAGITPTEFREEMRKLIS